MTRTEQELLEQCNRICASTEFREALWRHLPGTSDQGMDQDALEGLDARIHVDDQMLRHSLRHHGDASVALSQYYNVAFQQYYAMRQILAAFHSPHRVRLLDFACGYGRLIRLLHLTTPLANITASEIQPEALRFVQDRFGVRGVLSHLEPSRFSLSETFDFIWVASLFSHLPGPLFRTWLKRLWALVDNPDGVLCFSVHDASLLPEGLALPEAGILYGEGSEIAELAPTHYGTAYVSETFVRAAVREVAGADITCFRIPKGLAHEQDIYVVTRHRDTTPLAAFRRGPWGWVDERNVRSEGALYLRGWAASLDDGPLKYVSITVNGERHTCPTGLIREDVARAFQDPRLASSGWEFHCPLRSGSGPVRVEVSASTAVGEKALLYVGHLGLQTAPPAGGVMGRVRDTFAHLIGRTGR